MSIPVGKLVFDNDGTWPEPGDDSCDGLTIGKWRVRRRLGWEAKKKKFKRNHRRNRH